MRRGNRLGGIDPYEKIEAGPLVGVRAQNDLTAIVFFAAKVLADSVEGVGVAPLRPDANERNVVGESRSGDEER